MAIFFAISSPVHAAIVTWDGGGTTGTCGAGNENNFNCKENWLGDVAPTSTDFAAFDGTSTKDVIIADGISIYGIDINSGYTGTITQNAGVVFPNFGGGNGFEQADGTYTINSASYFESRKSFVLSGGTFNASSGTTQLGHSLTITGGTFNHNSGTLLFQNSINNSVYSCNNTVFNTITLSRSTGTSTIGSDCTFPLGDSPTSSGYITNNGVIQITSGNWSHTTGTMDNYGTITVNGTGDVTLSGIFYNRTSAILSMDGSNITFNSDINIDSASTFPASLNVTFGGSTSSSLYCGNKVFSSATINKSYYYNAIQVRTGCTLPLGNSPSTKGLIQNFATINIGTGTWTHDGEYNGKPTGNLNFDGTTINFSGSYISEMGSNKFVAPALTTVTVFGGFRDDNNAMPDGVDLTFTAVGTAYQALQGSGGIIFGSVTIEGAGQVQLAGVKTGDLYINGTTWVPPVLLPVIATGNVIIGSGGKLTGYELRLQGSADQTIAVNGGTFDSQININKTGGTVKPITDISTSEACTVAEKTIDLDGKNYICGSLTIQDGGVLRMHGSETVTTPTLNTGSSVIYSGDGDTVNDSYTIYDWAYKHLTIDAADPQDSFNCAPAGGLEGDFESGVPPTGWTTGGDTSWTQDTTTYNEGSASANTGAITHGQETWIKRVYAPATNVSIDFEWKVSSEEGYDYLLFCVDNDSCTAETGYTERISGEVDWTQVTADLTAGSHSLVWKYVKDDSHDGGTDEGWIDNVGELFYDINVDQNMVVQSGIFKAPGNLIIGGNLDTSSGTFYHKGAEVFFDDTSQTSVITGTEFYDLTITTPGKVITFNAGDTKTVNGHLTVTGTAGNLIRLQSSAGGSPWYLNSLGSHDVSYANVSDSDASGGKEICAKNSTDSTGNTNWDFTCANQTPTANDQTINVTEELARAITLSGNDPEGSPLNYTVLTNPTKGVLSGTAPNLTYTPATNLTGTDSFTFRVNDGTLNSATATITLNISNVNDAPVAYNQSTSTNEDTAKVITILSNDIENDALTYSIVSNPTHGILSGTGNKRTYTPAKNYNGSDSFTFKTNDGEYNSNTATVSLTVNAINDAPTVNAQVITVIEDTPKSFTLTGSDVENDPLTFSVASQGSKGTVALIGTNVTYTPNANATGSDSFTFKANDGKLNSTTATVTVTITPVNDTPNAPTIFSPCCEDTTSSLKPTISWNDAIDVDNTSAELKYEIRLGTNTNPENTYDFTSTTSSGITQTIINNNLSNETIYYYVVRTIDLDKKTSSWSTIQQFYVNTAYLPELTLTKASSVSNASIAVRAVNWLNRAFKILPLPTQVSAATVINNFDALYTLTHSLIGLLILILIATSVAILRHARKVHHVAPLLIGHPANTYAKLAELKESPVKETSFSSFKQTLQVGRLIFSAATITLSAVIIIQELILPNSVLAEKIISASQGVVEPGNVITVSLDYENTGDGDATSSFIADSIPNGASFIAGSASINGIPEPDDNFISGSSISAQVGSITDRDDNTNKSGTVSYNIQVNNPYTYTNTLTLAVATLTSNEVNPVSSNSLAYDVVWGSITGTVTNSDTDAGVSNVQISLFQNGEAIATTTTNNNGNYSFDGISSGDYTLIITPPAGYKTPTHPFTSLDPGDAVNVNIKITPIYEEEIVTTPTTPVTSIDEETTEEKEGINEPLTEEEIVEAETLVEDLKGRIIFPGDLDPVEEKLVIDYLAEGLTLDIIGGEKNNGSLILEIPDNQEYLELIGKAVPGSTIQLSTCGTELTAGEVIIADALGIWNAKLNVSDLVSGKNIILAESIINGISSGKKIIGQFINTKTAKFKLTFWLIIVNLFIILVISLIVNYVAGRKNDDKETIKESTKKQPVKKQTSQSRLWIVIATIILAILLLLVSLLPATGEKEIELTSTVNLPEFVIDSANDEGVDPNNSISLEGDNLIIKGRGLPGATASLSACEGVDSYLIDIDEAGNWTLEIPVSEIPNNEASFSFNLVNDEGVNIAPDSQIIQVKVSEATGILPDWLIILLLIILIVISNGLVYMYRKTKKDPPTKNQIIKKSPNKKVVSKKTY
ncbi:MAG: Ig-like domain-containing protein [bacterium]|nr:Ig-like domain-containing protein [bacterium]